MSQQDSLCPKCGLISWSGHRCAASLEGEEHMSRKAMKLALSTLEGWANYDAGFFMSKVRDWVWPESALEQAKRNTIEAITALRQALETDKQWVGLTDDEVEDIYFDKFSMSELVGFARSIEQALKDKNGGEYRNKATTERTKLNQENT